MQIVSHLKSLINILISYALSAYFAGVSICLFVGINDLLDHNYSSNIYPILEFFLDIPKIALVLSGIIIIFTSVPCTAFIIFSELLRINYKNYYIIFGGILGLILIIFFAAKDISLPPSYRDFKMFIQFTISGAFAGWVYWRLAGRNAGRFFNRPAE